MFPTTAKPPSNEPVPLELMFPNEAELANISPLALIILPVIFPPFSIPVVVILPAPTSIDVNPDVIEPVSNAPTIVNDVFPAILEYIDPIFRLLL